MNFNERHTMSEKARKSPSPNVVPSAKSRHEASDKTPLESDKSATGEVENTVKVQNSAPQMPQASGTANRRTAAKKKQNPPTQADDARLSKLEKMMEKQAEQNKEFQHNILNMMSGLMAADTGDENDTVNAGDDRHDDDVPNIQDNDNAPNGSAMALGHNISDAEDDSPSTSSGKALPKQNTSDSKSESETETSFGFASQFAINVDEGGPIRSDIASSLLLPLTYKLNDKKVTEALERHECPSNCGGLQIPIVNPQIWKDIPTKSKTRDLKLQRVQKPLVKGLIALSKLKEYELDQDIVDGLMLIANSIYELNGVRREMLKPDINAQFHHLCKNPEFDKNNSKPKSRKYYSLLFGDELGKNIKDLQEESKATSGIMRSSRSFSNNRHQPYPKRNPSNGVRQSFQAAATAAGWNTFRKPFLGRQSFKRNFSKPQTQQKQGQSQKTVATTSSPKNARN